MLPNFLEDIKVSQSMLNELGTQTKCKAGTERTILFAKRKRGCIVHYLAKVGTNNNDHLRTTITIRRISFAAEFSVLSQILYAATALLKSLRTIVDTCWENLLVVLAGP